MVFAMPIFLSTGGDNFDWIRVQHETIRIFPFFLIFLLNNFILFKFFKKKQYLNYSILIIIAVVVFSFIASFNVEIYRILDIPRPRNPKPLIVPHHQENQLIEFFNRFFYNVIFSILVLGFNNAFKILTIWFDDKRNFEQLQKEKLQIELEVLKNQISPHFLMNTLNNIHALIDYDKEIAKESVVKLSKLMRVLLYDSENENYSIKNEVQFLNDYISLMKIRVNDNVDIRFNYPLNIGDVKIPPLLFVSFVENAFKHGIKAIGDSYVHIELSSLDDKIFFSVSNSKSEKNSEEQNSKIGLENSRRRFDAIFNNNYSFDILETNDNFTVKISIPTIWK
jgi:LytS/YehU family sensor histidine kinase